MCIAIAPNSRYATTLALCAVVALSIGCNSASDRVAISGKVTFDGQPVDKGQIVFAPQGSGFTAVAPIVAGSYAVPAETGASPSAAYTVRITADRPTGKKIQAPGYAANDPPQEVFEQYIPAKYNESSELQLDVGSESDLVKDFDLASK